MYSIRLAPPCETSGRGGDAKLLEVLCDAAEEEWVAGAEDQTGVHVGRIADDALVEHVPDLVGRRFEHCLSDFVDASLVVLDRRRLLAVRDARLHVS